MMMIRQFFLAVILSIIGLTATAQSPIVTTPTFGDDTYVHVPLQFGFPFYGRVFTNSWMHSNGVVSFLDPSVPVPGASYNPASWAYCCSGEQPTIYTPQFSYMIAPLWTDLIPVGSSTFRTEGTDQYQRYQWNNIAEISNPSNLNSFTLEIQPSGFIGVNYSSVRIQNQMTWIGTIGDPTLGEWNTIQHGVPGLSVNDWSFNQTIGADICVIDPLSSPTCPGYTTAMCASNPLYNTTCSGYSVAYLNQQCASNPLYDTTCPGYATAYYNYQCSASALYHTGCVGYSQAYFDQQCNLDALYSNQCPGYNEAYAKKYILVTTPATETVIVENEVVEQDVVVETQEVAAVAESVSAPTVSASPSSEATSPVTLVASPSSTATTTATTEKKTETKSSTTTSSASGESKNQPTTTRQAITQRRMEAAREQAAESAKENPGAISKQMDSAASMEQQVELQNVVLGAMSFVAGFDAYGRVVIPDAVGYKPFTIYNNQTNVDNARMLRGLTGASDRLHDQMVDQQYR